MWRFFARRPFSLSPLITSFPQNLFNRPYFFSSLILSRVQAYIQEQIKETRGQCEYAFHAWGALLAFFPLLSLPPIFLTSRGFSSCFLSRNCLFFSPSLSFLFFSFFLFYFFSLPFFLSVPLSLSLFISSFSALIHRQRGNMQRSLELFQEAMHLNPSNIENAKQVARSLYVFWEKEKGYGKKKRRKSERGSVGREK